MESGSKSNSNDDGYMIARIKDIEEIPNGKSYLFQGKKCTMQIVAEHAAYKKSFGFNVLSNQKFTHKEFETWQTRMEKVSYNCLII